MAHPRTVRARLVVPSLLVAWALVGAHPAPAAPFEVTITARHYQQVCFGSNCPVDQEDLQTATGMSTDPTVEVETLGTLNGIRFFTRTTGPSEPVFASALARADGFYGVGVSGITGLGVDSLAHTKFEFSVTNSDTVPRDLVQTLGVEPINVAAWLLGIQGQGEFGPLVQAELRAEVTRILADGTEAETIEAYEYLVRLERDPDLGNLFNTIFSDDLGEVLQRTDENGNFVVGSEIFRIFVDQDGNPVSPDLGNEILGVHVDAFEDTRQLMTLLPGETAEVAVFANARVNRQAEQGGEAFIGDPFTVSMGTPGESTGLLAAENSFELRPVPEPSIPLLQLSALVTLAVARHSRVATAAR